MRVLSAIFPVLLVASLAYAAPASKEDDETITIDRDFFADNFAIYTAEHEIVSLVVPLNSLNFDDTEENEVEESDDDETQSLTLFFTLADRKENGDLDYKGLYVLIKGTATKLLDNGRHAAADNEDNKVVYLAAADGLYTYNAKENKAEKFGTLTDSITSLAKANGTDLLYILTDDHKVYKVTELGTKKELVSEIPHAHAIVLDYSNNLYFYGDDKKPYVYTEGTVKKIEGLPENPTDVDLIKAPVFLEDGVPFVDGKKSYIIYANGSSEVTNFELDVKPTAYAMEGTLIQYYAYNKKIYEYNILVLIFSELLSDLKDYLNEQKDAIQSIATRSRSDLTGLLV